MTITLTAPAAIALAIVLTGFMALYGLIGYAAWLALRERSKQRRNSDKHPPPNRG